MDANARTDQLLAAVRVHAISTRMLFYGEEHREHALVESTRAVMSLWCHIVNALMGGGEPSEPDVP